MTGGGSGAAGGVGGAGGTTAGDSGAITESIFGSCGNAGEHIPLRFQVHVQPWMPVSIARVVSVGVVSPPQAHVQFHVQVEGSGEEACAAALVGAASGPGELDAGVVGADRLACAGG